MGNGELALIKAWQQADERAVHALFNQYYPRSVRIAAISGLTLDEAQDCAQETFLRAFERRHQLRDAAAFPLWFQRIFTHHLQDTLKLRSRNRHISLEDANKDGEASRATLPEDAAIASEESIRLWQRVQALPPNYRLPLVLHYAEDFSLHEIARLLNKREGTIRVTLHRALKQLRLDADTMLALTDQPLSSVSEEKNVSDAIGIVLSIRSIKS